MPSQLSEKQQLIDKHKRKVSYLRISITDRCNFTCMYCRDSSEYIAHENILRFEEIERCIALFAKQGIEKIRFTGGEPFVRKGFLDFLLRVHKSHPELELCITSNGTFSHSHIPLLKESKVRINLSLDSFNRENFKKITGKDCYHQVIENTHALLENGIKLKINAVALKNINSHELEDFVNFARNNDVDVRFIEFMPMGEDTKWNNSLFWPAQEIIEQASNFATLHAINSNYLTSGPAKMYEIKDGLGRFGVITPLSSHFCSQCNRLRLTSEGNLRTCLFDDKEYALKPLLSNKEISDNELISFIQQATRNKKIGAHILENSKNEIAKTKMVSIGG